jgi:hypothetical protein
MLFLGSQKNELPCPDSETVSRCHGKIRFTISSSRVARGRGRFMIAIGESEVFCDRCGRIFKPYKDTMSESEYLVHFAPTGKVKSPKALYKIRLRI